MRVRLSYSISQPLTLILNHNELPNPNLLPALILTLKIQTDRSGPQWWTKYHEVITCNNGAFNFFLPEAESQIRINSEGLLLQSW